jgi:hypothetical protein
MSIAGHGEERVGREKPHLHLLLSVLWAMAMAMAMAMALLLGTRRGRKKDLWRIRKRDNQTLSKII